MFVFFVNQSSVTNSIYSKELVLLYFAKNQYFKKTRLFNVLKFEIVEIVCMQKPIFFDFIVVTDNTAIVFVGVF
jgi:hypothetical protein